MRKHIINIVCILTLPLLALLLSALPLSGQNTASNSRHDSTVYTLNACIDSAIANNVAVKNAAIEITKAENTKSSAFTNYFPKVSAAVGVFKSNHSLIDVDASDIDISISSSNAFVNDIIKTLTNIYGNALGLDANIKMVDDGIVGGVAALQPIFMGGRIYYGNQLAQVGVDAAKYQYELAQKDVRIKAEQNFWLIMSLKEKSKTIDIVTNLLDTLYKNVNCAYDAGITLKNDILKVQLKQNEMQSNRLKVDNGIKLAKMALCQYMGVEYNDSVDFVESINDIVLPSDGLNNSDEAVNQRTEAKLLDLSVEAEQLKRKMLLGETMPQVAVGAGYLYNNIMGKNNTNGLIFGTISIPISDWWSESYKLKKQDLNTQVAINSKDNLHEMMSLQMQQNWNELEESYKQVSVAQTAIEEAEENLRLAMDYYDAGLATITEVLSAQTSLQQSRDQYTDAYIQYRVKLSEYHRNR